MGICHKDCILSSNSLLTAVPTVCIIRAAEDILNTEGKSARKALDSQQMFSEILSPQQAMEKLSGQECS